MMSLGHFRPFVSFSTFTARRVLRPFYGSWYILDHLRPVMPLGYFWTVVSFGPLTTGVASGPFLDRSAFQPIYRSWCFWCHLCPIVYISHVKPIVGLCRFRPVVSASFGQWSLSAHLRPMFFFWVVCDPWSIWYIHDPWRFKPICATRSFSPFGTMLRSD